MGLWYMPTARPRHQVTETPDVARALDRAAQRWPGEPRSELLLRLVEAGRAALDAADASVQQDHRAAVLVSSGAYDEAFEAGFLATLRADWPA